MTQEKEKWKPFGFVWRSTVLKAALETKGGSGPLGLDADGWSRILAPKMFGDCGKDLREAIANATKSIWSTVNVKDDSLEAFLACQLVSLDKQPGVRPLVYGRWFGEYVVGADVFRTKNWWWSCNTHNEKSLRKWGMRKLKQFFLLIFRTPLTASIDKHYSITLDWYAKPSLPTSPTAIEDPTLRLNPTE